MKTIVKRILTLVLSLSIAFSVLPAMATSQDDALFQTESLNLFTKEEDGSTDWSKTITRAEFSHAMSILLRHNNEGIGYSLSDVGENTPYRSDIYNMLFLGLMNGDGNGNFRPNDCVTAPEAVTVFLRAMGYGYVIQGKEYPQGAIAQGITLGMLKNVNIAGEFTRRDFANMLHNSLDVNLMSENYKSGKNSEYYISDIKFADVVFSANGEGEVYCGVGTVMQTAMSFTDVQYQKLEINEVIIDGVLYDTGNTNVADLLGMQVRFLAKEKSNGSYVLMNIAPTEKNEVVVFDGADFATYSHDYISYRDENDKLQKIRTNTQTRIIKNYDTIETPSESVFDLSCGEYVVIDNDSDKYADVIMIYSYENAVVSGVANNVIALKEGFSINGSRYINLDEENDDLLFYIVDSSGKPIDVNTVSGDSVISVATDRTGKIMKIIVRVDALISDKIGAVQDDNFIINEVEYNVLFDAEYTFGTKYDFYLNAKGDIIYFKEADDGTEKKYGYIMDIDSGHRFNQNQIKLLVSKKVDFGIEINDEDADNITQIPMLICQNEEIKIIDMAEKVKVDGRRVDNEDVADYVLSGDCLYRFEVDTEGKLKSLETAEYKAGSLYQTFTYNIYDKCFTMGTQAYEGFAINENSQIICIPTNPTCDEDYMVKNVINKEGNTIGYNVRGYNYDPITKKCGLIVINRDMKYYDIPGVTIASSKVGIVKSSRYVLNEDDEYSFEVDFAVGNEEKKMILTEAATDVTPVLNEGDLFTYTEDYENRISNFMIIRSMSELTSDFSEISGLSSGASETFGSLIDISYDEVDEFTGGLAMEFYVDVNGSTKVLNIPQRNKPPIYVYNGVDDIYVGSMEDIVPGGDKVYVFMSNATTVSVVVVIK